MKKKEVIEMFGEKSSGSEIIEILNFFVNFLSMKPRRRDAIVMRIFHNMTFREIGEVWGVGPTRGRQIYLDGIRFCGHPERLAYFHGKDHTIHYPRHNGRADPF